MQHLLWYSQSHFAFAVAMWSAMPLWHYHYAVALFFISSNCNIFGIIIFVRWFFRFTLLFISFICTSLRIVFIVSYFSCSCFRLTSLRFVAVLSLPLSLPLSLLRYSISFTSFLKNCLNRTSYFATFPDLNSITFLQAMHYSALFRASVSILTFNICFNPVPDCYSTVIAYKS